MFYRLTALEKYEEFLQRVGTESTTNNIEALNMVSFLLVYSIVSMLVILVVTLENSGKVPITY